MTKLIGPPPREYICISQEEAVEVYLSREGFTEWLRSLDPTTVLNKDCGKGVCPLQVYLTHKWAKEFTGGSSNCGCCGGRPGVSVGYSAFHLWNEEREFNLAVPQWGRTFICMVDDEDGEKGDPDDTAWAWVTAADCLRILEGIPA